jgi:hypothetical protein
VSAKRPTPSKAKELYVSDWFKKARRYVEQSGDPWFILSAEHGLLDPDAVISPYERTLNRMGVRDRRAWAAKVIEQMERSLPRSDRIVVLAGERYREGLMDYLRGRTRSVLIPLEGLKIGEQLRWLGTHSPTKDQR